MKCCLSCCFLFFYVMATAQVSGLYHIKKDSSGFELTQKGASLLALLPLKCIIQQYPNKTGHVVQSDSDQLVSSPKQLHLFFMAVSTGTLLFTGIGCW